MKTCCNPMNRPHPKRQGGRNQKISEESKTLYKQLYPSFDFTGEKYLCVSCSFDMRKAVEALKDVATVSVKSQVARKSKAKRKQPDKEQQQETTECGGLTSSMHFIMDESEEESVEVVQCSPSSSMSIGEASGQSPSTFYQDGISQPVSPFPSLLSMQSMGTSSYVAPSLLTSSIANLEAAHSLNTTLNALEVTPVGEGDITNRQYEVKKTYNRAQQSLKGQFDAVAQNKFSVSPAAKDRTCDFCIDLLDELASRFPALTTKTDKYKLLTCIPKRFSINQVRQKVPASLAMIRNASNLRNKEGAFYAPVYKYGHPLPPATCELVHQFYFNNSRPSPRMNDTITIKSATGKNESVNKHRILSNLSDLYSDFKKKYDQVQVSESKFATLRPKNCIWPGRRGFHNTCVCEIHQNFEFMRQALKTEESLPTFIEKTICNPARSECYSGLCINCPNLGYIRDQYLNVEDEEEVEIMQWQHTDSTDIRKVTMPLDEFREEFEAYVPKIIEHDFVYRKQRDFINKLKEDVLKHEITSIMVTVDFAQNYTFLVQDAVQGFHWCNRQATVHPFVVHYWGQETERVEFRTYCVISNELTHDADTFHAFRCEVVSRIKEDFPELNIKKVYYISDGAGSQYKNFKNFSNLAHHEEDFGLKAEWHFTATSHGKSTCDAISGVVKSVTRLESFKQGRFITTADQMYNFCSDKLTSSTLSILYVDKGKVLSTRQSLAQRYKKYKTIPGSRKYHMFSPGGNVMTMKLTSSSEEETRYNFMLGETTAYTFESIQIGTFYGFHSSANYQVGMVVDKHEIEGEVLMQALKLNRRNGQMEYPNPLLFIEVPLRDIFCQVLDPSTTNFIIYNFIENEFQSLKASYRSFLTNRRNQ